MHLQSFKDVMEDTFRQMINHTRVKNMSVTGFMTGPNFNPPLKPVFVPDSLEETPEGNVMSPCIVTEIKPLLTQEGM